MSWSTPLKQIKNKIVVDEALIEKEVDPSKTKKLTDEEQNIKHENKKQYLRDYYNKNRTIIMYIIIMYNFYFYKICYEN